MSKLTWITGEELESEIIIKNNNGDQFCWKEKHKNYIAAARK